MQSHWCAGSIRIIFLTHFSSLPPDDQIKNISRPQPSIALESQNETAFLHDNTSKDFMYDTTFRGVNNGEWFVYMDIFLVGILAISAMLVNLGLLSLAGRTKPVLQTTGSNLSSNCVSLNVVQSSAGQTKDVNTCQRWRLFCCTLARPKKRPLEYTSHCFVGFTGQTSMQRYPSSISLCRSILGNLAGAATGNCGTVVPVNHRHQSTRSRRHRRYLRGLFGLAVSNLTIAFSLTALLIGMIVESSSSLPSSYWLTVLSVINIGLADLAQAVEIGAVLWIALERTFGIHWFKERRLSGSRTKTATLSRHSFTGTSSYTTGATRLADSYKYTCDRTSYTNWILTSRKSMKTDKPEIGKNTLEGQNSRADKRFCCCDLSMKCQRSPIELNNNFVCKWLAKRSKCLIRLILSFTPLALSLLAIIASTFTLVFESISVGQAPSSRPVTVVVVEIPNQPMVTTGNQTVTIRHGLDTTNFLVYYTDSIAATLVIGQFILPLTILITTNLLIYRKVASRDKRFFTRQSSDTSKSSFLSNTSDYSFVVNPQLHRTKPNCNPPANTGVPLLRVLESSNQDLHQETTQDLGAPRIHQPELSNELEQEQDKSLLAVPGLRHENSTPVNLSNPCSFVKHHRSASVIELDLSTTVNGIDPSSGVSTSKTDADLDLSKIMLSTPQHRRKSSGDILSCLFQPRVQDAASFVEAGSRRATGEEPLLLQMLRRQHRRTLRILIILLLVFVVCRGPRTLVLLLGWFNSGRVCHNVFRAYFWLQYTTWWAYSSAVLDTIVYGFWGNRAYRIQLRHWYTRCTTKFRRSSMPGLC